MRVRLIIQDREYCQALIETIARADKDIYIELGRIGKLENLGEDTLIVTDLNPLKYDFSSLRDYNKRVIFLTPNPKDVFNPDIVDDCQRLFKYNSISNILSDIEQINYIWTGEVSSSLGTVSRIYSVCSDDADKSSKYARALARQVVFRKGGNILVLSLKYVNEYANSSELNTGKFSRLLYYMDIGRDYPIEAFTYSDSYGISYMRLPYGMNPIA